MADFTLEPDDIEPERPERRRPVRMVSTGLVPTAEVPARARRGKEPVPCYVPCEACGPKKKHIPSDLVVECIPAHRKPPEVRIWRLSSQSCVGTVPPSTSTPHWPACWARR